MKNLSTIAVFLFCFSVLSCKEKRNDTIIEPVVTGKGQIPNLCIDDILVMNITYGKEIYDGIQL